VRLETLVAASALALVSVLLGCESSSASPGRREQTPAQALEQEPEQTPERAPKREEQTMRVLVTGFNDWEDLGEPPQLWRCRDNPSCRLLVGEAAEGRPETLAGPLVRRLEAAAPELEWRFATMPVTWGVYGELDEELTRDVDVVVDIGLGVYDRFDVLQLEAGAFNLARGTDAAGAARDRAIAAGAEPVLPDPPAVAAKIEALAGRRFGRYELVVAEAREGNSYLCNETHYRALSSLGEADKDAGPREAYFLHIPYAEDGDYEALAEGVAGVVLALSR
jgi:hypothetical protein